MKFLAPYADHVYAVLRIVAGALFAMHGLQKIFGVLADPSHPRPVFGEQTWWGGVIELVCGVAIALGLRTGLAAFLASGTMAVAYIQFHWKLQFDANFFPHVNQGELAVIYCFLFLYMACRGSGPWSLDAAQRRPVASNLGSAVRSGRG